MTEWNVFLRAYLARLFGGLVLVVSDRDNTARVPKCVNVNGAFFLLFGWVVTGIFSS